MQTPFQEACDLLREAEPLIPPDAPLRWYKNDELKLRIKLFLAAADVLDQDGN